MNQEVFDTVKKYYNGVLPDDERSAFENKVMEDTAFAEEARSYARMLEAIDRFGDKELDAELTQLGRKLMAEGEQAHTAPEETTAKIRTLRPQRWVWVAAAAVFVILILSIPFLNSDPATSPEELFAAHYVPKDIPGSRSETDPTPSEELWRAAAEAFSAKKYEEAAGLFEQVISDSTSTKKSEAWLFLGITRIELKQTEKAIEAFERVSQSSLSVADANWYMALSYLRINQPEKARPLLEEIVQYPPDSERKSQAEKILSQLPKS